jgi:hypothetical protein
MSASTIPSSSRRVPRAFDLVAARGSVRGPACARVRVLAGLVACALAAAPATVAQERLPPVWDSPQASVSQTIGISDVTVSYHRPGVKGRTIWGDVVPWGEVWRAGANENTTITLSHPVTVQGQPLAAGTYGLHVLPAQGGPWTVIFSRNASSWGSYHYSQAEDALRVTTTTVEAPFTEWLTYDFSALERDSAVLSLRWERLAVPLTLGVDTDAVMLAYVRDEYLRGIPGFSWQGWDNAAEYCLRNGINLEEALQWSQRSTGISATMTNLTTQAGLLEKLGRKDEAAALRDQALALATEPELNALGYQHLQRNEVAKAIELFKRNLAAHPGSWNAHDSLAEAYQAGGDKAQAIELYRKALALVQDEPNRARITGILKTLGAQ